MTKKEIILSNYKSYLGEEMLNPKNYEELIELEKLKHFDFRECISFWDGFDFELYLEVLKAKNR